MEFVRVLWFVAFWRFLATSPPNAHEDHFGSAQQREVKRPRPACGRQFPDRAEGDPFVAAAGRYTMLVDMPLNCMPPTRMWQRSKPSVARAAELIGAAWD